MTVALRTVTPSSMGKMATGMDTMSKGPIGDVGGVMQYRSLGARCFVV